MVGVAGATGGGYPVNVDARTPERIERWRPLLTWLFVIPHIVVLYVLNIVVALAVFVGWFAALFTGRLPEGIGNIVIGTLRYAWRVQGYTYALATVYPGFGPVSGDTDPGDYQVRYDVLRAQQLSRVKVLFRIFLAIPQFIALYFVGIVAGIVAIVAWFAVLITGRWPEGLRQFYLGYSRWNLRFASWYYMLVDDYPPFALR